MTINTRNPVWANAEQTLIDCEIEHPEYGWIPFTASPNDSEQHGRDIFSALSRGAVGAYVTPPAPSYDQLRAAEYPPITDYLDGVVKGDQAQIDKYIADCQAVKVKYPKPQA